MSENISRPTHLSVQRLLKGEWSAEQFRQYLAEAGAPLVERVGADLVDVTFVDETASDTTTRISTVIGPMVGRTTIGQDFVAIEGTPFRYLTLRARSDLRFGYVFTRTGRDGEADVADPFNPPPRFSDYDEPRFSGSSVVALPDAYPLPWLERAEALPAPAMEAAAFTSDLLGNDRRIWVSMPAEGFSEEHALPLVIQLDGSATHSAPSVRGALLEVGAIRPCAVVLVDQLGAQRYRELLCNPGFSRMLVEELLPWLRDRYPLSNDPADVALAGESYGGLCAAWTALHHPGSFGNIILQSPSCGYHAELGWGHGANALLRRAPVPTLMAEYLAAERAPIRVFHDVGELEDSITTNSRWFDQVLRAKGYDTLYREFAGGHDYAWWRGLFADALRWCFPPASPTRISTSRRVEG